MPPPRRNTSVGLVLGIGGAFVLLLMMLGISTVWILTSDDNDDTTASSPTTEVAPTEATPTEVAPPTPPPTSAPPTSAPPPPTSPTPTDNRLRAGDYEKDWNYKFGDSEAFAAHQQGWDHSSCAPVEVDRSFTRVGCEYAVEVTYRTTEGDLQLTNIFLGMSDEASATRLANGMTDEQFDMQRASFHPDSKNGRWRTRSVGATVVLTVVTAPASTPQDRLDHYVQTANTDFSSALLWR